MKFTLAATVLLTFSLSAFAVEYPVLTNASPDQEGLDSQQQPRLEGWNQNQIAAGYPSIN
ncbi:penicillin binding protein PBP4B, partial [Salmonella enterica subsp. enterica serovar Enteritidis]